MICKVPTFADTPAFPSAIGSGIPMRDLFALVALHATLSCSNTKGSYEYFALDAYQQADAMIAARSFKEGK